MHVVLFDEPDIQDFLPLAFTRPTAELRCGIRTNTERWTAAGHQVSFHTRPLLVECFPNRAKGPCLYANGRVLWNANLRAEAEALQPGEALIKGDALLALAMQAPLDSLDEVDVDTAYDLDAEVYMLQSVRDLFGLAAQALRDDFDEMTLGRTSAPLSESNRLIGNPAELFIEPGAWVEGASLNTEGGPIYIGKDAVVMEGSLIRGGLGLCHHAEVKMGAKLYGANTIGPWCKVGGEVDNSVFQAYSNKGHDGYVGNSVIGAWCNLGADTNTSNLKNNYSEVKVWSYRDASLIPSGLTFCGLVMGDHSKCAINTQLNTGTTVGVNANIFGHGFAPKFVPSWAWGGFDPEDQYDLERSFEVAERVMARRKVALSDADRRLLQAVFDQTADLRS